MCFVGEIKVGENFVDLVVVVVNIKIIGLEFQCFVYGEEGIEDDFLWYDV